MLGRSGQAGGRALRWTFWHAERAIHPDSGRQPGEAMAGHTYARGEEWQALSGTGQG